MNKGQLIFNLRMEAAAIRQALRDSQDMELTNEQINRLLDRLKDLLDLIKALDA